MASTSTRSRVAALVGTVAVVLAALGWWQREDPALADLRAALEPVTGSIAWSIADDAPDQQALDAMTDAALDAADRYSGPRANSSVAVAEMLGTWAVVLTFDEGDGTCLVGVAPFSTPDGDPATRVVHGRGSDCLSTAGAAAALLRGN